MARPKQNVPTDRELEILHVLWEAGPSSTRDIVEALNFGRRKKIAYNSIHTVLTIMHDKGLVRRDESSRSHVFSAAAPQEEVEAQLIGRLTRTLFGGSTMRLVARALSTQVVSEEDAEQIRHILGSLERGDDPFD